VAILRLFPSDERRNKRIAACLELTKLSRVLGARASVWAGVLSLHLGAGKTTTMRVVAGLQPATRGGIKLKGIRLEDNPQQYKQGLGLVPDSVPVYEQLTVVEFLDVFAVNWPRSASTSPGRHGRLTLLLGWRSLPQ